MPGGCDSSSFYPERRTYEKKLALQQPWVNSHAFSTGHTHTCPEGAPGRFFPMRGVYVCSGGITNTEHSHPLGPLSWDLRAESWEEDQPANQGQRSCYLIKVLSGWFQPSGAFKWDFFMDTRLYGVILSSQVNRGIPVKRIQLNKTSVIEKTNETNHDEPYPLIKYFISVFSLDKI